MSTVYEIVVRGECSAGWHEWFGNLQMECDTQGNTHFKGALPDQAALLGLLLRLQELNLLLLNVERVERIDE